MKRFIHLENFILLSIITLFANGYFIIEKNASWLFALIPAFLLAHIFIWIRSKEIQNIRLRVCYCGGCLLLSFAISVAVSVLYHVVAMFTFWRGDYTSLLWSAVLCIILESIVFWVGMISVYCTSVQLGIRRRVLGYLCGLIPIVNVIALVKIIRVVFREVDTEVEKEALNKERAHLEICKTKYPILLVHGVFFRDSRLLNYWGRIPSELAQNGAEVVYGEHESARPVAESAKELAVRIKRVLEDYHCEKVNIIAHSKGGLDCRYALQHLGIGPQVASLTTINTPHRGCIFAEYLLQKVPQSIARYVADAYNASYKALGDRNPDFIAAVTDLTASACQKRDAECVAPQDIFCQSVGSRLNRGTNGRFPLNFSYHLVKHFDGPNDGLVSEDSFQWGERYQLLTVKGKRGISHGDIVDMNRENIPEFDVREFYVQLVADLKNRGL